MTKKTIKKEFLVPKKGLRVLDPVTGKPLAKEGEMKPLTVYWRRRLRDEDVSKGEPSRMAPKKSKGE